MGERTVNSTNFDAIYSGITTKSQVGMIISTKNIFAPKLFLTCMYMRTLTKEVLPVLSDYGPTN